MLLSLDIVVVLEAVLGQQLLHFLVWTWRNFVNHRPWEGNLLFVLQIGQECFRYQSVLYPTLSVCHHTSLDLVAIVRAVVHRLHSKRQFTSLETLEQQGADLTHGKHGAQATSQVSLVIGVALLRDGE